MPAQRIGLSIGPEDSNSERHVVEVNMLEDRNSEELGRGGRKMRARPRHRKVRQYPFTVNTPSRKAASPP
jgi:hypothetical protein